MATLDDLQYALENAKKAGDQEAVTGLSAVIENAKKDRANLIPGVQITGTTPQAPESTMLEKAIGAGETALTLGTAATGGTAGMIAGTLKGLAEQILSGQFGTQQANQAVQQSAMKGAQAGTYTPRTRAGAEMAAGAAQTLGEVLPPVLPIVGPVGAVATGAKMAAPAVQQAVQRVAPAVRKITSKPQNVGQSVGAMQTPDAIRRDTTATNLPVPFEGESGLTKGQATRDFTQLQFEKESAKLADVGAPLRERVSNQTATMLQNFDSMINKLEPLRVEKRDIGRGVSQAIVNKANVKRNEIRAAYQAAEDAGETLQPVEMAPLAERMVDLSRFEGVSPNIAAVKREAVRLGALVDDGEGNLQPGQITLKDSELLRQFVNDATDWTDRRQSLMARRVNESIDAATEGAGGELYQLARGMRSRYAKEFENVGITAKLLGTKGKTDERAIALEDVFDRIILNSPIEEMNKVRKTLLTAGNDGKQSWNDLKAKGLDYIKTSAQSASQMDEKGNPLLSADKLNKVIRSMDEQGKLESLYGKKQAQSLRDLAELSSVIYTAPPGSVNTSNTASALRVALDSALTFGATGVPAPAATLLKESAKYIKDRKTKARIMDALKGIK